MKYRWFSLAPVFDTEVLSSETASMWEQLRDILATQPPGGGIPFADVPRMLRKNGPIIARLVFLKMIYIVSLDVYM